MTRDDLFLFEDTADILATGFTFTEGPIWNKDGQHLDFSDMPANIRRLCITLPRNTIASSALL